MHPKFPAVRLIVTAAIVAALLCPAGANADRKVYPPPVSVVVSEPGQRVAIGEIDRAPVGADISVIGYYSHKSNETDGDLQVYLIDHKGSFVVVESPRRFRPMKSYIRSLHFHRGDLVIARGTLTRQFDKPTDNYPAGWMEINPVTQIAHYTGDIPDDLHYVQVTHALFGRTHVVVH
jgi:hypothetical protein